MLLRFMPNAARKLPPFRFCRRLMPRADAPRSQRAPAIAAAARPFAAPPYAAFAAAMLYRRLPRRRCRHAIVLRQPAPPMPLRFMPSFYAAPRCRQPRRHSSRHARLPLPHAASARILTPPPTPPCRRFAMPRCLMPRFLPLAAYRHATTAIYAAPPPSFRRRHH